MSRVIHGFLATAVLVGFGLAAAAAAQNDAEAPAGVVNYTRVDATVACAGATVGKSAEAVLPGMVVVVRLNDHGGLAGRNVTFGERSDRGRVDSEGAEKRRTKERDQSGENRGQSAAHRLRVSSQASPSPLRPWRGPACCFACRWSWSAPA